MLSEGTANGLLERPCGTIHRTNCKHRSEPAEPMRMKAQPLQRLDRGRWCGALALRDKLTLETFKHLRIFEQPLLDFERKFRPLLGTQIMKVRQGCSAS